MKLWAGIFLILAMSGVAHAAEVSTAPVQGYIADWALIQSKGGLKLGLNIQHDVHTWKLNLECDLWANGSNLVIQKTLMKQEGNDIFIALVVNQTAWTLTPDRGQCKSIMLDSTPGLHAVYYRDAAGKKDLIGYTEFKVDNLHKTSAI